MKKQNDSIQTGIDTITKGQEIARACVSTVFINPNASSNIFSKVQSHKVFPSHSCKGMNDCKQIEKENARGPR